MKLTNNIIRYSNLLAATVLLAGCSADSYMGTEPTTEPAKADTVAISFMSSAQANTRATGAEAAALLGGSFCVYGEVVDAQNHTHILMDNYQLNYQTGYGEASGYQSDWAYVGLYSKRGSLQNIKYWDYSAKGYSFIAFAGLPSTQLLNGTKGDTRVYIYNVESATNLYVADRVTATPKALAATETTAASQGYADKVTFDFRRIAAMMRIGFYETVPGYAIKDLIFYYVGAESGSLEVGVRSAFPQSGSYTVSFDDATNRAHTTFVGAKNQMAFAQSFGQLQYTSALCAGTVEGKPYIDAEGHPTATPVNAFLGTTSNTATYGQGQYTIDGQSGVTSTYRPILPNEDNTLMLQMRVDYTLVSLDGKGEEIHVRDAHVNVPVKYSQWKSNHAYTYLFKISDNSNGYTGVGGGGTITTGPGRDPDPDHGGGDRNPSDVDGDGVIDAPYIPDPSWPLIPNPDYDPSQPEGEDNPQQVADPRAPLIPNPKYPAGRDGDQGDPSNPVPDPEDVTNPSELFPITFDAVIIETQNGNQTHEEEVK